MTITYNFRIHLQDFSQKQQIVVVCQNKLWHASSKRKSLTVKETKKSNKKPKIRFFSKMNYGNEVIHPKHLLLTGNLSFNDKIYFVTISRRKIT